MKNKDSINISNQKSEVDINNFPLKFCSSPKSGDKSWIKKFPTQGTFFTGTMGRTGTQEYSSKFTEIKPCSLPQIPMQISLHKPHVSNRWYTKALTRLKFKVFKH